MRITDIFDAVRDGTYADFLKYYTGDPNLFNKYVSESVFSSTPIFVGVESQLESKIAKSSAKLKYFLFIIISPFS